MVLVMIYGYDSAVKHVKPDPPIPKKARFIYLIDHGVFDRVERRDYQNLSPDIGSKTHKKRVQETRRLTIKSEILIILSYRLPFQS